VAHEKPAHRFVDQLGIGLGLCTEN